MLPKKAVDEFKKIYKKRYGQEPSDEEASFRANKLFGLYKAVYIGPVSDYHIKEVANRRKTPKKPN